LNFYKQELTAFPAQNNRAARLYAQTLSGGLSSWILQHPQDSAIPDVLLMQTRLQLRAKMEGAALVTLFKLRYQYPQTDATQLAPLWEEALQGVDGDVQAQASQLFTQPVALHQGTASQVAQANLLYAFSKLSGKNFYPAAQQAFEQFFTQNPTYSGNNEVELWYGDLHRGNGNYLAAIFQYKKAGELYPDSPYKAASMRLIGDIYADNLKDTETALHIYTQVLQQFPKSSETGVVYKHMAILDENAKQYDSALINYDKAIELLGTAPTAYEAYRGKADVYVKTKNYAEAYNLLTKTAVLFQAEADLSAQALQEAARIAQKYLRDPVKQAQALEKLLLLQPNSPQAPQRMYELGQVYEQQAATDKARTVYRQLVLKYPTDKYASKAQKRLNRLAN
ncbi:MAG: tetratricopeptide repeat protein, partial [Elusimicrobiaceae bacterium]|nr:tetratricopeptide repeat protein [Elusimicrobiaceae bacterium]